MEKKKKKSVWKKFNTCEAMEMLNSLLFVSSLVNFKVDIYDKCQMTVHAVFINGYWTD